MPQSIFDHAAQWVHQRRDLAISTTVPLAELTDAIAALHEMVLKCKASVMLPDLFPSVALEAIFVPSSNTQHMTASSVAMVANAPRITGQALTAIGQALVAQLAANGNDMAVYEFDDGAQAIAYLPDARETVLRAVGLTLLND